MCNNKKETKHSKDIAGISARVSKYIITATIIPPLLAHKGTSAIGVKAIVALLASEILNYFTVMTEKKLATYPDIDSTPMKEVLINIILLVVELIVSIAWAVFTIKYTLSVQ